MFGHFRYWSYNMSEVEYFANTPVLSKLFKKKNRNDQTEWSHLIMDSKLCMMKRIYCQFIVTTSKITRTNPGLNIKLGQRVKVSENGICYKTVEDVLAGSCGKITSY